MNRRNFVKNTGLAAAAFSILPSSQLFSRSTKTKVRLGIIGVGLRGQNHLYLALKRSDTEVVAICDISERMLNDSLEMIKKSGKPTPKVFKGDVNAWKKLLEIKDLDGVIIATPWEWHAPMIIGSLEAGVKYVGSEVILGITLQDHWDVIHAAERHKGHVMMLENVCYRRDVMAILNMVRQGMFGELMHLQAGYQHDLRAVKFNNGQQPYGGGVEFGEKGFSEAAWRTNHSVHRNGDLYPTHGIGPVAEMLNINYGNRFVSLSSFATKARGLHEYVVKNGGENHPNAKVEFKLGDVVTTMINCANGETILLQHDTNLPRPYSLGFRVQGTKGIWMDVNHSLYIEGTSSREHSWEEAEPYLEKYDHPLWQRWTKEADGAGHGGMDFFVVHAFIESIKNEKPTPIDVYDSAAWSAITPLSEQSISLGNQTVDFPDFTSGQWMYRKTRFAPDDTY
ncbi:MAG TPA: Gfo/Idh/MocA family oxidoreductase [Cyclobacteriaceae bacterium]|nr:Gfo/Idh/MocA family oxidoreductase [Cyclobacteriaceae bacterium]HMV08252.1 Gfo/Idh/MocA family oxidoreductase [Cyclobacteriaceae bacterium]HMV91492.1 Gfo/Idh/MocA family oxidoreductase [Cyclobacteriaceae bacterium]HMX02095.1 Gfo/Idh/MocA family oxidoreductase [Cyclobacteriaceae bacterium]HMX49929.1 Gfo/Idh/MocA family oxidoreductase [Cyclobacteriaceae bacterium]